MDDKSEKTEEFKHDDFITTLSFTQNIISRMATMCTICKLCVATIYSVFIIAGFEDAPPSIFIIMGVIIITMAALDGMYLFRERNYIGWYNELIEKWSSKSIKQEDYFKLSINSSKRHPKNTKSCPICSHSILPFYGVLLFIDFICCMWRLCNG